MSIADLPAMLVSESAGWNEVDRSHRPYRRYLERLVLPLALLPPLLYAYATKAYPGVIFPLAMPEPGALQLVVSGLVFYGVQIAMVGYMAMVIQRMARARDHDPGYDGAYALAAIAPVPLWLASLALLVPSRAFCATVAAVALVGSIALIRHGVRPLLHVADEKTARYVANVVVLVGVAAWLAMMSVAEGVLSLLLG